MSPTSVVLEAWRSDAPELVERRMRDDVVFSSPFTEYVGRAAAGHLLRLIPSVLSEVVAAEAWEGAGSVVARFEAAVGEHDLEGVLVEESDQVGSLVRVTLYLRPYSSLRAAMKQMGRVLETNPPPGKDA